MRTTVKAENIIDIMIVELRRYFNESELLPLPEESGQRGVIVNTDGRVLNFKWNTRDNNPRTVLSHTSSSWSEIFAERYQRITDEAEHINKKEDLVDHLWKH